MNQTFLDMLDGKTEIYPNLIEANFPRVFSKLLELWPTPHIDSYLQDLMVDTRGGDRAGFPLEAASEIMRLSNYLDDLRGPKLVANAWNEIPEYKREAVESLGYELSAAGLLKSVDDGNKEAVHAFLSCGVNLEARDERNWTPLMISSFNGNEEFALLLIKCGAKLSVRDKNGYAPVHWAAFNGYTNVVKLLLDKGADPNSQSQYGWTPLMQAATRGHLAACECLIAQGANVNLKSLDEWTALHKAANNGHTKVVKLLLDNGADLYAKYKDGSTALDLATKGGHQEIMVLLKPRQATPV
jgi:ankyrin repeat protein